MEITASDGKSYKTRFHSLDAIIAVGYRAMTSFTESVVEEAALEWFEALGYAVVCGPTIAPGEPDA